MNQTLINKFKNVPTDQIMKVGEVKLLEPKSSKRKNEEEFEFTFTTNAHTDPEWREIFKKHYGSEKAKFHGSEFTLICRPTELDSEVSKVKLLILSTEKDYQAKRESLISAINANKEEERVSAVNRNAEEDEVAEMFKKFRV